MNEEEKIIRDWIDKAKPIVESAWNLALDTAIGKVKERNDNGNLDFVIMEIENLKKKIP